jgi:hypothetical protein
VLDHLVYGTPDLAETVDELGTRFGMQLSEGGQHLGFGTRNYLADLGDRRYLEVVGPDLDQPKPEGPRLFGVDSLRRPTLVAWAARVDDLDVTRNRALSSGYELPPVRSMARDSADGVPITWRMTPPMADLEFGGLVPFFVEWGDSPHPADRAARGAQLVTLTVFTPDVAELRRRLEMLGQDLPVQARDVPGLLAELDTPAGRVVLD